MLEVPGVACESDERLTPEAAMPGWDIVAYRRHKGEPPKYAVEHWGRRRAWGLRTEEAAHRWLTRLLAATPVEDEQLVFGVGNRVAVPAATSA